jgi:nitrate/nitrite-specific signal transduction histidine kinase
MKRPTTRDKFDNFVDKFDNFVDKFDNFANHGGIIFLRVVLIVCIYFFSYRQLPVIDLRDKEVETKPRIEQI